MVPNKSRLNALKETLVNLIDLNPIQVLKERMIQNISRRKASVKY